MEKKYSYEEYKEELLRIFRQKYAEDVVKVLHIVKNNDQKVEAICIKKGTCAVSPVIYLSQEKGFYTQADLEEFIERVEEGYETAEAFSYADVETIMNWETARTKIYPKLVNYEMNKEALKTVPFIRFLNLAVIFFCPIDTQIPGYGKGAVTVKTELMNCWGISLEELGKTAMDNLKKQECKLRTIDELLGIFAIDKKEKIPMYICSVYNGMYGAAALLNLAFLEQACEKMRSERILIIPSSVHESILLPSSCFSEAENLRNLCTDLNGDLEPEDILSDEIYVYDNLTKRLDIAGKGEIYG